MIDQPSLNASASVSTGLPSYKFTRSQHQTRQHQPSYLHNSRHQQVHNVQNPSSSYAYQSPLFECNSDHYIKSNSDEQVYSNHHSQQSHISSRCNKVDFKNTWQDLYSHQQHQNEIFHQRSQPFLGTNNSAYIPSINEQSYHQSPNINRQDTYQHYAPTYFNTKITSIEKKTENSAMSTNKLDVLPIPVSNYSPNTPKHHQSNYSSNAFISSSYSYYNEDNQVNFQIPLDHHPPTPYSSGLDSPSSEFSSSSNNYDYYLQSFSHNSNDSRSISTNQYIIMTPESIQHGVRIQDHASGYSNSSPTSREFKINSFHHGKQDKENLSLHGCNDHAFQDKNEDKAGNEEIYYNTMSKEVHSGDKDGEDYHHCSSQPTFHATCKSNCTKNFSANGKYCKSVPVVRQLAKNRNKRKYLAKHSKVFKRNAASMRKPLFGLSDSLKNILRELHRARKNEENTHATCDLVEMDKVMKSAIDDMTQALGEDNKGIMAQEHNDLETNPNNLITLYFGAMPTFSFTSRVFKKSRDQYQCNGNNNDNDILYKGSKVKCESEKFSFKTPDKTSQLGENDRKSLENSFNLMESTGNVFLFNCENHKPGTDQTGLSSNAEKEVVGKIMQKVETFLLKKLRCYCANQTSKDGDLGGFEDLKLQITIGSNHENKNSNRKRTFEQTSICLDIGMLNQLFHPSPEKIFISGEELSNTFTANKSALIDESRETENPNLSEKNPNIFHYVCIQCQAKFKLDDHNLNLILKHCSGPFHSFHMRHHLGRLCSLFEHFRSKVKLAINCVERSVTSQVILICLKCPSQPDFPADDIEEIKTLLRHYHNCLYSRNNEVRIENKKPKNEWKKASLFFCPLCDRRVVGDFEKHLQEKSQSHLHRLASFISVGCQKFTSLQNVNCPLCFESYHPGPQLPEWLSGQICPKCLSHLLAEVKLACNAKKTKMVVLCSFCKQGKFGYSISLNGSKKLITRSCCQDCFEKIDIYLSNLKYNVGKNYLEHHNYLKGMFKELMRRLKQNDEMKAKSSPKKQIAIVTPEPRLLDSTVGLMTSHYALNSAESVKDETIEKQIISVQGRPPHLGQLEELLLDSKCVGDEMDEKLSHNAHEIVL